MPANALQGLLELPWLQEAEEARSLLLTALRPRSVLILQSIVDRQAPKQLQHKLMEELMEFEAAELIRDCDEESRDRARLYSC